MMPATTFFLQKVEASSAWALDGRVQNGNTWNRVARYIQGIFTAKKREVGKRETTIDEHDGVVLLH